MAVTPFTLITTIVVSVVVICVLSVYLNNVNYEILFSPKALIIILLIPLLRMFLPIEFSFAKVIRSYTVYPAIVDLMTRDLFTIQTVPVRLVHILLAVWIAGFAVAVLKDIAYYKKLTAIFRRLPPWDSDRVEESIREFFTSRNRRPRPVAVIRTAGIREPLIFGVTKPTIVLPRIEFSDQELANIIGHELSHYIHGDLILKWILCIFCAVYWWIPPVYRLKIQTGYVMEIRADQEVIGEQPLNWRARYCKTLLRIIGMKFEHSPEQSNIAMFSFGDADTINRRINAIVEQPNNRRQKQKTVLLFFMLVVIVVAPFCFVVQPYINDEHDYNKGSESIVYTLPDSGSYLVKREDNFYDLYIHNEYLGYIETIQEGMEEFPIIDRQQLEE